MDRVDIDHLWPGINVDAMGWLWKLEEAPWLPYAMDGIVCCEAEDPVSADLFAEIRRAYAERNITEAVVRVSEEDGMHDDLQDPEPLRSRS